MSHVRADPFILVGTVPLIPTTVVSSLSWTSVELIASRETTNKKPLSITHGVVSDEEETPWLPRRSSSPLCDGKRKKKYIFSRDWIHCASLDSTYALLR